MDINSANSRLSKVKIRIRGDRLSLRATLPTKDGTGKKQQDIATGLPATPQGLKLALAKAQSLESDILLERFTWELSAPTPEPAETKTIEYWCDELERTHWQTTPKTASREHCFKNDYKFAFNQLPPDEPVCFAVLKRVLVQTPPDSRSRQRNHQAYSRLAKIAGVELPPSWKALKGKYEPGDRLIPSEDEIIKTWERLTGRWRWAFGMMASYGLRNHEIVRCSFEQYPVLNIWKNTKTKDRIVYPLHPDWPDKFGLIKVDCPQLTSEVNSVNGRVVSKTFKRHGIEFNPYALRDAYAVRGAVLGVNPAVMSKWMGHSLDTHYRHYLKWIQRSDFDNVWAELTQKKTP